jgi:hypothetical protein
LEDQLLVLLLDDRQSRKDWFQLDQTTYGMEQAEERRAVQPDLISSSLPEKHKHLSVLVTL